MILLTSQKNSIYEIIEAMGLSPLQFEFVEVDSVFDLYAKATKLLFKNTGWYFQFEQNSQIRDGTHAAQYSPGKTTLKVDVYKTNWSGIIKHFWVWLEYLKREITSEDKWSRLNRLVESSRFNFTDDFNQLTFQEYENLVEKIDVLKERISKLEIQPQQIEQINAKLDHITELSKKMTKMDWRNLFVGTIISILIQLSLSPEVGQQILDIIRELFSTYFLLE